MEIGDILIDTNYIEWEIIDDSDIHNIECITKNDGSALFCLDEECDEYDGDYLKLKDKNNV